MKNNYHERKQAKIERYTDLSEKNEKLSETLYTRVQDMSSVIPLGQPILVGHHSEKRDRNYRGRIDNTFKKSIEASDKAKYYAGKVATIESNRAISSDDPDAIEKLQEKLEGMKTLQEHMKACNKIVKNKKLSDEAKVEKLVTEHNLNHSQARKMLLPDFCGRIGYPDYALQNNNGNMATVKKRIEQLKSLEALDEKEETINGVRILFNVEGNRVQIFFPGKPEEKIREELKRYGFRWAPTESAWQKNLHEYAFSQAKEIITRMVSKD